MGGFEAVDPRYRALYERVNEIFAADGRVAEVRLTGSVSTATADEWSDLDVLVVSRDEPSYRSLVDGWQEWLGAVTPTVFARRPLGPSIVNAVSAEGLSFDIAVIASDQPAPVRPTGFAVGFLARERFPDPRGALEYALHEQLRGLAGPMIKFLKRGMHVEHFMGIGHTMGLLTTVLLVESGTPPPARGVTEVLSPEHAAVLEQLPPVRATFDALLAFELAIAREVVTRSRPLFERHGLSWPVHLEAVAARRVRDVFGADTPWLFC